MREKSFVRIRMDFLQKWSCKSLSFGQVKDLHFIAMEPLHRFSWKVVPLCERIDQLVVKSASIGSGNVPLPLLTIARI